MKARGKIILGLLILGLIGALWLLNSPSRARRALDATRRSLRQQGFKIDLSEFDLSVPPDVSARAALIGTTTRAAMAQRRGYFAPIVSDFPGLLTLAGPDAALVTWKLQTLRNYARRDLWPELRDALAEDQSNLEVSLAAAISGPIRFQPIGQGPAALLPYLADLRGLERIFALRTIMALHDGHLDQAWTNLLGATCLVTSYTPEPIEVSQLVRFACATIAFETTWNALQAGPWTDDQLADLQRRWEAVDFWSGLPEAVAYSRASTAAAFQLERTQPFGLRPSLAQMLHSPGESWQMFRLYWQGLRYKNEGSFEAEKDWLLYARDREVEMRRVIQCVSWSDMRTFPGVTNGISPFHWRNPSAVTAMLNSRRIAMAAQSQGQGPLGRAATAEAMRRLLITAIALERYRLRQGSYPTDPAGLVPTLLASPPVDFMDGRPLRYHRTDDGHFLLYSVGLDGVDDGGKMRQSKYPSFPPEPSFGLGTLKGFDLVWPRPASEPEVERLRKQEQQTMSQLRERDQQLIAKEWWGHTRRRQAKVDTILKTPSKTPDPAYQGRPLSQFLRNQQTSGTNQPSIAQMLTLHQLVTGSEPETVTFEVLLRYDALTNVATLDLFIDPVEDNDSDEGCHVGQMECKRAANGNCLLVWSTLYETPGKHVLQAGLELNDSKTGDEIVGPFSILEITNLCQLTPDSAHFERDTGVKLRAKLPEPKGSWIVDVREPGGKLLRTLTNSTANGIITIHWDLTDDRGNVCTNDAFDTVLHVTLAVSGRTQTLRGP